MMIFHNAKLIAMSAVPFAKLIRHPSVTSSIHSTLPAISSISISSPLYSQANHFSSKTAPPPPPTLPEKQPPPITLRDRIPQFGYRTVPYTKRSRFLLLPNALHKKTDLSFQETKASLNSLPETDPQVVRAKWILKDIVDVLNKGLVPDCPKYVDEINWEIFVLEDMVVTGGSCPGGKIFISIDTMERLEEDGEVAAVLGLEVARVVAEHFGDMSTIDMWFPFISKIPVFIFSHIIPRPSVVEKIKDIPFNATVMHTYEIDHIAVMLMAFAGYDSKGMVAFLQKKKVLANFYPSAEERIAAVDRVMEEAVSLYEKVTAKYHIVPRSTGGLSLIPKDK